MNEVFSEAQPGAILGASWGQIPTQHSSPKQPPAATHIRWPKSPEQSRAEPSHTEGYVRHEPEDDDNVVDDEYANLVMTGRDHCVGGAKDTATTIGWADLVDPNFQIKANGLGSGNLHRKGANYVPVDESYILQQRNKLPSTKAAKKVLRAQEALPRAAQCQASAGGVPPSPRSPPKTKKKAKAAKKAKPITSITTRDTTTATTTRGTDHSAASVDEPAKSRWNTEQLVSVPFWQQSYTSTSYSSTSSLPSPHTFSSAYDSGTVSTTTQTSPRVTASLLDPPRIEPVLIVKVPIATGINVDLPIGKDDPEVTVKRFVEKHSFDIDDTALHKLHRTVAILQDAAIRRIASFQT
ncbi:hypothetical protein BCR43DRAFT_490474 [Syncephalastrum racemosum]|uniref:Uncharacterized protein n=1 Tax=Syncephalastrum racemosum TaxID=13706 RepID=A0A1X2HHD3_SYNRA|nr:hypothetical protein BCR43DRAFT_490474 [Syncephalastrum racemosum]